MCMVLLALIATPFSFDAGAGLHWCCAVSLYVAAGNTGLYKQPALVRSNHLHPGKLLFDSMDVMEVTENMHL